MCLETRMDTGLAEGIRVYPARIIQVLERGCQFFECRDGERFTHIATQISQILYAIHFLWIIG